MSEANEKFCAVCGNEIAPANTKALFYMILTMLTGILPAMSDHAAGAPSIPSGAFTFDNFHSYKVYDIGMTWHDAEAYCESLGGHLAVIASQDVQDFVFSLVKDLNKNCYWLGGRNDITGNWQWVTNEPFVYTNWDYGEPNNGNGNEHYLQIYRVPNPAVGLQVSVAGKWNDLQNDCTFNSNELNFFSMDKFGFVCEWDNTANSNQPQNTASAAYMETLTPSASDRYTGNMGDSFISALGTRNGKTDIYNNSYTHGLEGWVARWNDANELSWVWNEYQLNGRYSSLTGLVALLQSYNTTNFQTQLDIIGDGNILYSMTMTPSTLPANVSVNVKNVNILRIYLHDNIAVSGGTSFGLINFALSNGNAP